MYRKSSPKEHLLQTAILVSAVVLIIIIYNFRQILLESWEFWFENEPLDLTYKFLIIAALIAPFGAIAAILLDRHLRSLEEHRNNLRLKDNMIINVIDQIDRHLKLINDLSQKMKTIEEARDYNTYKEECHNILQSELPDKLKLITLHDVAENLQAHQGFITIALLITELIGYHDRLSDKFDEIQGFAELEYRKDEFDDNAIWSKITSHISSTISAISSNSTNLSRLKTTLSDLTKTTTSPAPLRSPPTGRIFLP